MDRCFGFLRVEDKHGAPEAACTELSADALTLSLPAPQSSSICRAAMHYGILDSKGGLVDVTRNGKVPFFVRSERNGVESLR